MRNYFYNRHDFAVRYDPATDDAYTVFKKIFYSVIVKQLKHKKPQVIFISGNSGEGKSLAALSIMDLLLDIQGVDLLDYMNDVNIYTPLQYPKKIDALLFDKRLKKVNTLCMHEAREVVKAKNWASFLSTSVADVNAMSRSVKRLCTIIVSQFIRDITTDMRYTLNHYLKVKRYTHENFSRIEWEVMYKDDRDLERPKIMKRRLNGYLIYPDGTYRKFRPAYIKVRLPRKEVVKLFEEQDKESKSVIIRSKLTKLIADMREEAGLENTKIIAMLNYYTEDLARLSAIGRRGAKGKWKLKKEVKEMHEISEVEFKQFERLLNERLNSMNVLGDPNEQAGHEDIDDNGNDSMHSDADISGDMPAQEGQ